MLTLLLCWPYLWLYWWIYHSWVVTHCLIPIFIIRQTTSLQNSKRFKSFFDIFSLLHDRISRIGFVAVIWPFKIYNSFKNRGHNSRETMFRSHKTLFSWLVLASTLTTVYSGIRQVSVKTHNPLDILPTLWDSFVYWNSFWKRVYE